MFRSTGGSIRLFRVARTDVFLHWSWLAVAWYQITQRPNAYHSQAWNIAGYLSLFVLVLLHEFGHVLACRQVGGKADKIVLWPLGGVAYVSAPPRPGAVLWSIAAGPLVNVVLLPVTMGLFALVHLAGWKGVQPDLYRFLLEVGVANVLLLVFNLLPIYPLDGGQIAQALLWFWLGRARSLLVVSIIGLVLGTSLMVGSLWCWLGLQMEEMWWITIVATFMTYQSWIALRQSRLLAQALNVPRHLDAACPDCKTAPPMGNRWKCHVCQKQFDTFDERGVCPGCGMEFNSTMCPTCHARHPMQEWFPAAIPESTAGEELRR